MQWIALGLKLMPLIVAAVEGVEKVVKGVKGKDKQDAAMELVASMLVAIEGLTAKDLLQDEAVQTLARSAIDAVVAFQNGLAASKKLKPAA